VITLHSIRHCWKDQLIKSCEPRRSLSEVRDIKATSVSIVFGKHTSGKSERDNARQMNPLLLPVK